MDASALIAFAIAFFVFAASPGPDNMTIIARTVSHGAASGIVYGLGTLCGILTYLGLAAFGLSIIAQEMGTVMMVIRYAGAIYLIYMAYRLWTDEPIVPDVTGHESRKDLVKVFATAIALNLGNPKMPLFYLALLPGFVGSSFGWNEYATLAGIIILVEIVVVGGHVYIAERTRALMRSPAVIRRTNRIAGSALGLAGLQIVWTTRSN